MTRILYKYLYIHSQYSHVIRRFALRYMISERQKDILKTIIEEHIMAAGPVSSKTLAKGRGFDIGAPMLRKEMNQLEKEGYLAQPHTSAGRVPTDKAYRLYIQENLSDKDDKIHKSGKIKTVGLTSGESQKVKGCLQKNWADIGQLLKEISRVASDVSRELSVAGEVGGGTYTCGFSNLFDEPEFKSFGNINQLMRFMDNIDGYFDAMWNKFLYEDMQVFIGGENPIKEINEFTLITGKYQLPQGEPFDSAQGKHGFISIIGPKRMNYRRNMALVEYISKVMNND